MSCPNCSVKRSSLNGDAESPRPANEAGHAALDPANAQQPCEASPKEEETARLRDDVGIDQGRRALGIVDAGKESVLVGKCRDAALRAHDLVQQARTGIVEIVSRAQRVARAAQVSQGVIA